MKPTVLAILILVGVIVAGTVVWRSDEQGNESLTSDSATTPSVSENIPPPLAEEKQQYIWNLEHATFEIESRVGKPFAAALQKTDKDELSRFFLDSFRGHLPTSAETSIELPSQVSERSWSAPANSEAPVTAVQFIEHLAGRADEFQRIRSVRLRVLKITADAKNTDSGKWMLVTLLTVSGTGRDGRHQHFEQTADVVCEFANKVKLDDVAIFTTWTVTSESLRRSSTLFEEVTAAAELDRVDIHDNWKDSDPRQYTSRIACDDFNRDGFPDIAVITNEAEAILLQGDGKSFTDVTTDLGLPRVIASRDAAWIVSWIDFDNDGFSDLLLGPYLYRNRNGRLFQRMNGDAGIRFEYSPMGCSIADYDCDGRLDVYVVYQHPAAGTQPSDQPRVGWVGDDTSGAPNQLWRNLGDGRFQDVTQGAGVAGGTRHSFAAAWLHANEDHYPDLYVANDFAQNSFFMNRGDGTFEDVSIASGTADFATSMGVATGDIDNDGTTEIYVANMYSKMGRRIIAHVCDADYSQPIYPQLLGSCAGNRMYQQRSSQDAWTEVSEPLGINAVGWAYAPALADFDSDGFLDIYATAGFLSFERDEPDG